MTGDFKRARLAMGLTQKDLASKLGVSPSRVSRWEGGTTPIPEADADRIREILGIPEAHESQISKASPSEPEIYRGRPRSLATPHLAYGVPGLPASRSELVHLLSDVLNQPADDCEFLLRLAIDEGPITMRATLEMSIVALAVVAKGVITQPKVPEQVVPVYLEHAGRPHHHPPLPPHHGPPHHTYRGRRHYPVYPGFVPDDDSAALPLGVPVGVPESMLQYSFVSNRFVLPSVMGPNHERAGFVLISNLVYQIWSSSTGGAP